jgi:hypothetical protein
MHAPRQAQWPQAQELNMFAAAHFERTQLGSEAKTRQVRSTADSRRGDDHRTCSAKGQKQPSYLFVGQSHSAPVSDILPMGGNPNNSLLGSHASPLSEKTNVHSVSRSEARWYLVESPSRFSFLIEHDPFGKPLHAFPDHALAII